MKNIVLIGFMGTGKTVIGKKLAFKLGRDFIDTDSEIEKITGKKIPQIFAQYGEIRFRSEERLIVKKISQKENLVIATGGGIVLNSDNVADLKQNGVLICLSATPETIYNRVKGKRNRPLLNQKNDLLKQIKELLEKRKEVYQVAEFTVSTDGLKPEEVVTKIINYLTLKGIHAHKMRWKKSDN